jgi:folylpolyglutamate synthase/dihydropteroate synthase
VTGSRSSRPSCFGAGAIDVAVLEVGYGARCDNVVTPIVSVIVVEHGSAVC